VGQASFAAVTSSSPTSVKVRSGDTLWGLSRKHHVDMNELAATNGMRLSDILAIGRVLRLPGHGPPPAPAPAPPPEPAPDPGAPFTSPAHYTAAQLAQMRSFCATYQPPGGSLPLPRLLVEHPERLALRPLFEKWSKAYGVAPDLVEAVAWQESGWQNDVVSWANAQGIGQLLPQTADFVNAEMGTNLKTSVPSDNIQMMARFLHDLSRVTNGNACNTVAAYYEGVKTLQTIGALGETQTYVRSVLGLRPRFR
jgi:LysM repeat protein